MNRHPLLWLLPLGTLLRRMSLAHPLWDASRTHGELLKLGIEVSQPTVAKYIPRRLLAGPDAPDPVG